MPTRAHDLIPGLAERDKAFYAALQTEDDLGAIVRAHIHIEHELQQYILAVAPVPDQVKFSDLDFEDTVRLALVLGLKDELKSPLAAIAGLRNKFSHRLEMRLGEQEANNLYKSAGAEIKEIIQKTYANLRKDFPNRKHPESMNKLSARDRVDFFVISIRGGLIAERLLATRKI